MQRYSPEYLSAIKNSLKIAKKLDKLNKMYSSLSDMKISFDLKNATNF